MNMSLNPLISIIIPVYNVESYISRCLDSTINQTLANIEIIVVDDCGSDKSIDIAKDYAKRDYRIKIIHNPKNLGTFNARIEGIKEASGEYILFLDADDYLELSACERAYSATSDLSRTGHCACGDFYGNFQSFMPNKLPQSSLDNPQNSSTILECQESDSSLGMHLHNPSAHNTSGTRPSAPHSQGVSVAHSHTANTRIVLDSSADSKSDSESDSSSLRGSSVSQNEAIHCHTEESEATEVSKNKDFAHLRIDTSASPQYDNVDYVDCRADYKNRTIAQANSKNFDEKTRHSAVSCKLPQQKAANEAHIDIRRKCCDLSRSDLSHKREQKATQTNSSILNEKANSPHIAAGFSVRNRGCADFCEEDKARRLSSSKKQISSIYREKPTQKPDIVFFGMRFSPPTWSRISPPVLTKPLREEEILYEVFAHCATPPWHIWAKLYKASHIARVSALIAAHMGDSSRLTMAEDVLKSFYICALATSSVGIRDKLYVYCDSASSITRKIDTATRDKKINDISCVINELDSLKNIPQIASNKAFPVAQKRAINILKSVIALEYRYDSNGGGGSRCRLIPPYLRACINSLRFHRKWQTFARIAFYLISLGKIKI